MTSHYQANAIQNCIEHNIRTTMTRAVYGDYNYATVNIWHLCGTSL